ncbi:MAG: helix-turn-helix transcriptional regulator [Tenericutes bacterium]|nr:helix-turn-helix transcriptional regulator [Mycoplasmatota bacterium]
MNTIEIGKYIKDKRTEMHLTQKNLAHKLNISFQSVSKWETGNALPETSILLPLSDVLEITVDQILNAGEFRKRLNKKVNIEEVTDAIKSIIRLKEILGSNNGIYKSMVSGVNNDLEVDLEAALLDIEQREILIAQSCIQLIIDGYTLIDKDIDQYFKSEKVKEKLRLYVKKYTF